MSRGFAWHGSAEPGTPTPVALEPVARRGRGANLGTGKRPNTTWRPRRKLMLGQMQDWPLLIHRIIDHAATYHGGRRIISRSIEGPIHTTTYAEIRRRAKQLAQRLVREGVKPGDRVATLAWNTWR